ncbi:MAG: flagellar regulator YcgR PilZN domain-containing protein [Gallionellaceae bacterium]
MFKEKEIPLKVEVFANGEEQDFLLHSRFEIKNILKTICERKTRAAIYYGSGKHFVLTMVIDVSEEGIWIDPASRSTDNRNLLNSSEITFVSSHNDTKVQFTAANPWQVAYEKSDAIFIPIPESLLRLQRRDAYRLITQALHPLSCMLQADNHDYQPMPRVKVRDISIGGLSLEYPEKDLDLKAGAIYPDCEITLPEFGTLKVSLQVQNTFDVTNRLGKTHRRVGCKFIKQDRAVAIPLQRYVAQGQIQATANR